MSTDELIDKIIADELDNIDMYSTKYIGILSFEIDNNYYVEFSNRHDAIEKLNYKIDLANENDNLYDDLNLLYDILTNNIEKYKKNNYNNNVRSTTNNIKTPNGTSVEFNVYTENMSDEDIVKYHDNIVEKYPNLENNYIYPATNRFNCHSYSFYCQDFETNNIWINDPFIYYFDFSYEIVTDTRPGDIIVYNARNPGLQISYISHTGIIVPQEYYYSMDQGTNFLQMKIRSKWGNRGVYEHSINECDYYDSDIFEYITIYRPRCSSSYSLGNYNYINQESLSINSYDHAKDKYEMYELTPNYTKNYEFIVSSNSNLDVRLYDVHMQLISYVDTDSNQYSVHFTKKLENNELYYLRVAYTSSSIGGTINTQIISEQIESVDYGENILVGNEYSYYNSDDSGLFKISIININGNSFSCPSGTISIYSVSDIFNPLKRLSTSLYELDAVNGANCNNMIVYLNFGETYYIEIDLPITNYSDYKLKIERIYQIEHIDLLYGNQESYNIITNETGVGDNFKKIEIVDDSNVCIEYDYVGTQSETIYFVLYKEIYNSTTNTYSLQLVFPEMMVTYGESLTWSSNITEGIYYIGYYNKTNSASTISITIG